MSDKLFAKFCFGIILVIVVVVLGIKADFVDFCLACKVNRSYNKIIFPKCKLHSWKTKNLLILTLKDKKYIINRNW